MTEEFYVIWNRSRGFPIMCPKGFTLERAKQKARELATDFGWGDYFVLKNVHCVSSSMGELTDHPLSEKTEGF